MTSDKRDNLWVRHRLIVLLLLGTLLYIPWLGFRDFWYPDEPDLAEVCRAMYLSGDWIVPRAHGEIWVDYPPMLYWVGTLSSHALGRMSEFALRLPSALAAIALALATCAVGSRWFSPRAGLWAGLVLLTSSQFIWQAIGYRPDVLFSLFIGLGLFVYARGFGERERWGPRVAGFALLGGAILTKGPLGLLLPGLVLTLWHGARREWRRLFELAPLALVSLAVAVPWYVACGAAMGTGDILREMYLQNLARFGSGFRGHGSPPYHYLIQIWVDLAPWALLLPVALWWIVRKELWRDRNVQLALWWFGAFFVFLSIAVTKRQLYLLPAYPAAALLIAPWLSEVSGMEAFQETPNHRAARAFVLIMSVALLAGGVLGIGAAAAMGTIATKIGFEAGVREVLSDLRLPMAVLSVISFGAGLWMGAGWRRGKIGEAFSRLAVSSVLLFLLMVAWLIPVFNPVKTYVPQSRWIREQVDGETRVGLVSLKGGYHRIGGFAYYTGIPVELLESHDDVTRFFREHPRSLVLVQKSVADEFFTGRKWSLLPSHSAGWRANVFHEFEAAGYRYLALRSTGVNRR